MRSLRSKDPTKRERTQQPLGNYIFEDSTSQYLVSAGEQRKKEKKRESTEWSGTGIHCRVDFVC